MLLITYYQNCIDAHYIYGSVSQREFHIDISDNDFIAIITRKATEIDINILKKIHSTMQLNSAYYLV